MYKEIIKELDDSVIYEVRETIMKNSPTSYRPIGDVESHEINNDCVEVKYRYDCAKAFKTIRFTNGSEIKVLNNCNNKPSDVPMMIFAVNMANPDSEDYSCVNYYCSRCGKIVSTIHLKNGIDNNEPILPANCPSCGIRFKGLVHSN